jgi:uncharacterized membrane protein YcaP (DUF421 family)
MSILDYSNLVIGIVLGSMAYFAYFDYRYGRMKYFYVCLCICVLSLITFLLGINYG